MFPFFDPNNHKCLYKFVQLFSEITQKQSFLALLYIAPGKSDNKKLKLREKYKGTTLHNASNFIARSQILMFPLNKENICIFVRMQ